MHALVELVPADDQQRVPVAVLGPMSDGTTDRRSGTLAGMKKLGLISLALLAALFLAVSAFAATKTLTTSMKGGSAETPKGDPNGKGTAKIKIEASKGELCYRLTWSGISTPVAAHIHKGKKGVAGAVVIPLFAKAKHTGCVKASKSLLAKIVKSPASYYVNVHTQQFPGGAIRAQL